MSQSDLPLAQTGEPACEPLDARLRELEARGAGAFDPEGVRFAARLLSAGLRDRAAWRIEKLEAELAAAQSASAQAVTALTADGFPLDPRVEAALEDGDLRMAVRHARHAQARKEAAASSGAARWARSLLDRARSRAVRLPDGLSARLERLERAPSSAPPAQASEIARALSQAIFSDALSSSRATVALARAVDNVPEDPGPYNPQVLAARALAELAELAPAYTRAFIAELDELAPLDDLPPLPKTKGPGRRSRA